MIDSQTLILMLALGNGVLAASLYFFSAGAHPSGVLKIWSRAKILQALAWSLLFFRAVIPDFFSVVPGIVLLLGGIALETGAMWESIDFSQWRKILYSAWAASCALLITLYFMSDAARLQGLAGSFILGAFYGASGTALMMNWHCASRLRRFVALSTVLIASMIAMLGVMAGAAPNSPHLMGHHWIPSLGFIGLYALMLTNGFGFLLLAREQHEGQIHHLALVDPLTDAPNRRSFLNALNPWLALARRPGHSTAVLMLDLDYFKRINDSYGHAVGDQVLKAVVDIGKTQLRDSDMIGRMGGEEFAVLLPRTSMEDALLVAERMRLAIMALQIKTERAILSVTASFGVTLIQADDSVVSLFKRADEALYAAKNAGRNCVMEAASGKSLMV